MNKQKLKALLDYVPLMILTASAIALIAKILAVGTGLFWQHYVGFAILPVNYALFAWRHKAGVLGSGLTLLIGLAGMLSYSFALQTLTVTAGKTEAVPIFYGQPIFLLWLVIHFVCSGRHYVGIATGKYWDCLLKDEEYVPGHLQNLE